MNIDLRACASVDVEAFGHYCYSQHSFPALPSFEQAADFCARIIYDSFYDGEAPLFKLVRVFRITHYDDLLPELQTLTDSSDIYWVTLMGTMGDDPNWQDRRLSKSHRAMSADTATGMMKAVFQHTGVYWGQPNNDNPTPLKKFMAGSKYFHVERALGSPYINDQITFVQQYHIHSVVGLASPFPSGAAYMLVAFSGTTIDANMAKKFAELAPYISTLLAGYDQANVLWNSE